MMSVKFIFFFFFKQKTAFEMRISDWSSDVFSSDLLALHDFREADDGVQRRAQLMAHVGQELRLGAVGELGALLGADQRLLALTQGGDVLRSAAVAEKAAAVRAVHRQAVEATDRKSAV